MKAWVTALTPLVVALLGVLSAYVRGKDGDADGTTREGGARLMASIMDGQNRILDQLNKLSDKVEQLDKLPDKVDQLEARLACLEKNANRGAKRGRKWV